MVFEVRDRDGKGRGELARVARRDQGRVPGKDGDASPHHSRPRDDARQPGDD